MPEIKPVGDRAITVEFANEISIPTNQKVHALDRRLTQAGIPGIVETVPTYRTLIVHYEPSVIRYAELKEKVAGFLDDLNTTQTQKEIVIELPVLYGGEVPLDDESIRYDG